MCNETLVMYTCGCSVVRFECCDCDSDSQIQCSHAICDEPWNCEIEKQVECTNCMALHANEAALDEDRRGTYTGILVGEIPLYIDQVGIAQAANDTRRAQAPIKRTLYEEFAEQVARNRVAEKGIQDEYVKVDGKGKSGKNSISVNSMSEGSDWNEVVIKARTVAAQKSSEDDTEDDQFVDAPEEWDE